MDDYEKWKQYIESENAGLMRSIYHGYKNRIRELEKRQQATQEMLDKLYSLEPSFRRIFNERLRVY